MSLPPLRQVITADTRQFDRGIRGAGVSLRGLATAGAAAAAAVVAGLTALTAASMKNIDATAKQARSLGLATSALQAMSLVADEAGVSTSSLSSMLGLMQRNIAELSDGTQTQVDAFNALGLSITDLQGLNPDEQFDRIAQSLDAITDPTQRTAIAMDVFGRSGRAAINMLSGYAERAAEAERFQRRFGIAVSDLDASAVEEANDAVGRLSMVMEGLGNRIATAIAPAIESAATAMIDWAAAVVGTETTLEELFGTLENARSALGDDVFGRMFGNVAAISENAASLQMVDDAVRYLINDVGTAAVEFGVFAQQLNRVGEIGAAEVMQRYADELRRTAENYANGVITGNDFMTTVDDLRSSAERLVVEMSGVDGVSFSSVIVQIANLEAKLDGAREAADRLTSSLPSGMADEMTIGTPLDPSGPILFGDVDVPRSQRPRPAPRDPDFTIPALPGGGGAVASEMGERLAALQAGLATESETVQAWYESGLETIANATDAELEALGGRAEAIERLESEHQDRLAAIREAGNQNALRSIVGAGQQILGAIGQHNKRAMAAAQALGQFEAMVNAYRAASQALADPTLPWFAKASAAASVLATGIGFASSIGRMSGGGGGSGGGAGGGGFGVGGRSTPLQATLNLTGPMSELFGGALGDILDRLNDEAGDRGYQLLVPR